MIWAKVDVPTPKTFSSSPLEAEGPQPTASGPVLEVHCEHDIVRILSEYD